MTETAEVVSLVEGWDLDDDWVAAAVYTSLATWLHACGDESRCREFLNRAAAAATEPSHSTETLVRIADVWRRCGEMETAMKILNGLRPARKRKQALVQLLARARRADELEAMYRGARSAEERVELALGIARAWADG